MKQKLPPLLAGMLAVFALGALPSLAAAAEWSVDLEAGTFPTPIASNGGAISLTSNLGTMSCTSVTGTGQYTSATTGTIQLLFHGCTKGSENCTTVGQSAGTTTTTVLVFHNEMIDSTSQTTGGKPGILITPNEGHIATFVCGGIFTVKVKGNGIISEVTNPTCSTGTFQKTMLSKLASISAGSQRYKQIETAGASFDLTVEGFGLTSTTSEDAELTTEFTSTKAKMTCP